MNTDPTNDMLSRLAAMTNGFTTPTPLVVNIMTINAPGCSGTTSTISLPQSPPSTATAAPLASVVSPRPEITKRSYEIEISNEDEDVILDEDSTESLEESDDEENTDMTWYEYERIDPEEDDGENLLYDELLASRLKELAAIYTGRDGGKPMKFLTDEAIAAIIQEQPTDEDQLPFIIDIDARATGRFGHGIIRVLQGELPDHVASTTKKIKNKKKPLRKPRNKPQVEVPAAAGTEQLKMPTVGNLRKYLNSGRTIKENSPTGRWFKLHGFDRNNVAPVIRYVEAHRHKN